MTTLRHTLRIPLLAVFGGVLLLASCSSDPPSTALPDASDAASPEESAAAHLDPHDALLKFAQCMRDHGVDVPDPVDGNLTVDGRGLTQEQMDAAGKACDKWQQMAEPQDGGRELTEDQKQAFLDQAQCMRDRGWNVSDPEFDGGRVSQHVQRGATAAPGDPKPGDPQFEKDLKECADAAGVEPPTDSRDGTDG